MSLTASAQTIFVANYTTNSVGEYDATSGATINASFASGATILSPVSLALLGSNLLVSAPGNGQVAEYNIATGALVTGTYISGASGSHPSGLALAGNTLYVSTVTQGNVNVYDATTRVETSIGFITAANGPGSYPNFLTVSGSYLYVSSFDNGTVSIYNTATGFSPVHTTPALSASLYGFQGVVVDGSKLLVANSYYNTIAEFNATTGALINASFITGLNNPTGLALSGSNLYVTNYGSGASGTGSIGVYNASTGGVINAALVTGLSGPEGLVITAVPEPSAWALILSIPVGLVVFFRRRLHLGA